MNAAINSVVCEHCGRKTKSQAGVPDECEHCGEVFGGKLKEMFVPSIQTSKSRGWPMLSDAVGVHPDQIPEARRVAREQGVPTDFNEDGRVVFRSRAHRKKYIERCVPGVHDLDGGYGDP